MYPLAQTPMHSDRVHVHDDAVVRNECDYYSVKENDDCFYLRLMTELGFVNLNNNTLPTKNDRGLEECGRAYFSQPRIHLTRGNICLHCCLANSILLCPPHNEDKPLLECELGLCKKALAAYGLCGFTNPAPPAHTIQTSLFPPPLCHLIATSTISMSL